MLYLPYMLKYLINLLYPALCQACGKKSESPEENICKDCLKKIKKRLPPFCTKCGKQLRGDPELQLECSDCKNDEIYFDRAFSVCYYSGTLKGLIHNFKYKKISSLIKEFSDLTLGFIRQYDICKDIDLVLPVPMHRRRLIKREINTSHVMARDAAKRLGIRYDPGILKKHKYTPPQSSLKRHDRIKNIRGSFCIKKAKAPALYNKNILIIDDLFTTGSTVNECARILKEAGCGNIDVITLARGDSAR